MQTTASLGVGEFTLEIVAPHLQGFEPPTEPFDPRGDWQLAYGIYTLARRGARLGSLELTRRGLGNGTASLTVDYEKAVPGNHRQKTVAEIVCRSDRLSTPVRWKFDSQITGPGGKTVESSRLSKSGHVRADHLEITDGRSAGRIALPKAYTVNWALFDAVMRLPRGHFEPLRFTLFDHFDQVKPSQTLGYRKTAEVVLGPRAAPKTKSGTPGRKPIRKPVRLHAYDQLGEGIVPWVWWVDDHGRLLVAVSGLEAYLFERPGT